MPLPIRFNDFNALQREIQLNDILETNNESTKYGLSITAGQASDLISMRNRILKNYGRVELDLSVTKQLIKEFQSSPYIQQDDYVDALNTLHEIFYHLKNVTDDRVGDADLIALLKDSFENACGGSLELLEGIGLEEIARNVKTGKASYEELY